MTLSYKKKILIVYYDNERLDYFKQNISQYPFDVITALDGSVAFELAQKEIPDIILASAQLAGIDGFDLCWMIRQTPELLSIPYLLITEKNNPEERINAYRSGVDAFLDSTTSIREIYTLIETMVKRVQRIQNNANVPDKSLQGKLIHFSVVEILQMLNISKKSGELTFVNQQKEGKIGFWDGKIVWAESDQLIGEDAVKEIVFWKKGYFLFEKDLINPIKNIKKSTMQLILDCCHLLDEKNDQQ